MFSFEFVILIIALALFFDFVNGFHDAANSISTVVSTRVLSPRIAVLMAAFFNFAAFFILGEAVATTIGKGIIVPRVIDEVVLFSALIGAISWDLITWFYGLPTSSSHALIGGLLGAGLAKVHDLAIIEWAGLSKTTALMVGSPVIGLAGAYLLALAIAHFLHHSAPHRVNRWFSRLQVISSSFVSLSHGSNDAQKTMGIITALLISTGYLTSFVVPVWVALLAYAAMGSGTFAGGWRIVRTMGLRITRLRPVDGFAAETTAGGVIMATAVLGIPISTTHAAAGAILGVGAMKRFSAVRWGIARRIVWAWMLTIPAAGLIATTAYAATTLLR